MKRLLLGIGMLTLSQLPLHAEGLYISTYGGGIIHDGFQGAGEGTGYEIDADTGYVIGGIIGMPTGLVEGSSVEFEASYRSAGLDGWLDPACGPDYALGGNDQSFGVTVNLRQEAEVFDGVHVYGKSGLGYGWRRISITPNPSNFALNGGGADEAGLVWLAAAGVEYEFAEGWRGGVGYQYFNSLNIDRVAEFGKSTTFFESEGDSHAVFVSLTRALN